jgi:hypothetical protein
MRKCVLGATHLDRRAAVFKGSPGPYSLTAVPELLYAGTAASEWHFPQENATFHRPKEGK